MARRPRSYVPDDEDSEDQKIIQEAKENFQRADDWESAFNRLFVMDTKFRLADSDNGWQWPDDLRKDREANKRPALTINKVGRMVDMITNDARQNKPSISIKPTGNDSSYKSAQIYEGLVRDIEYKSTAQSIYDDVMDTMTEGGIGYCRLNQVYTDPMSFDQDLRIEPIPNPLSVRLDCDIKQKDGSDAMWGFIFDDVPRKTFEKEHPDVDMAKMGQTTGLNDTDTWLKQDHIRIAEYYRIQLKKDELFWVEDSQGQSSTFLASKAPKGFRDTLVQGKYKKRKVVTRQLEWFKIAGHQIIDRRTEANGNPLKGQYIPIARAVGIERVVDGKLERKGFIRGLKDAQRMFNYNASGEAEGAALQTKTPWYGSAAAFEGNEKAWTDANRNNAAYLTFNHLDSEGNPLPAEALPQRLEPPKSIEAFLQGMQLADNQLSMVSGMENAHQGRDGNEKSGKAIAERQRQGDTANYLWINNLALMVRYLGRMIVDQVPHIYDTKRVIQIMGKDGTQSKVTVDPQAEEAYAEQQEKDVTNVLFNPNVGKYEVESDIGPAYATQRQEAWNAFVQIVTGAPALIDEIGDLMFRSADFPLADKIAERLRRKIQQNAPYLLEDGAANPQMQQLQQLLTDAQGQVGELIQKLAEKNLELKDKEEENAIGRHEADSKRLTAETNSIVDLQKSHIELHQLMVTITQTLNDMKNDNMERNTDQADPSNQDGQSPLVEGNNIPPFEGAKKAQDGNWYAEHEPGKFAAVMPGVHAGA